MKNPLQAHLKVKEVDYICHFSLLLKELAKIKLMDIKIVLKAHLQLENIYLKIDDTKLQMSLTVPKRYSC
jgi:hypothetical protein